MKRRANAIIPSRAARSASVSAARPAIRGLLPTAMLTRPGDAAEREAERVASLVTSMATPPAAGERPGLPAITRAPTAGSGAIQRRCAACAAGKPCHDCPVDVHRQASGATSAAAPAAVPSLVSDAVQSGQPLDRAARAFFEPRFEVDFAKVRIHDGTRAVKSARALGALAYTVGRDIVFAAGQYAPTTTQGRRLLAHELTHVVQQTGGAALVHERADGRIARTPIDLQRLDHELTQGEPLTRSSGEIGAGATRGAREAVNPPEDEALPITLEVFEATPQSPAAPAGSAPSPSGSAPSPSGSAPSPRDAGPSEDPLDAGTRDSESLPGGIPEPPQPAPPQPAPPQPAPPQPAPPPPPRQRALIVSGVHGDERGPLDLGRQLQSELASATAPLRRNFDVLLIPVMNPGGVADHTRENRRGVDLNRNFPGLSGFPAPSGAVDPRQPETRAIMNVVRTLRPARILALHAQGDPGKAGASADPVEGPARELACRMALRMRGGALGTGATTDRNTRGNELANNVCNSRYPDTAAVSVTTAQSSFGAWASAPTAIGGQGIPVITHETAGKSALAATGARSVATIMPGLREFLLDNGRAASEADALLRGAISTAFLTGRPATPAEQNLLDAIERIVQARFADLAAHYRAVWRPAQISTSPRVRLPPALTRSSQVRRFSDQAAIIQGQISSLGGGSTDPQIETAVLTAMQTRSMPGFSRHHWGTEIDVLDPTRSRWTGSGDLVPVIPFLQTEAPRFGFFHPYAAGAFPNPSQRHYQDEPWHISYAPIANVLAEQWRTRITGTVLDTLIRDTATAIRGNVPQATMERVLTGIGLTSFQTNVAPSP
jgi:predicted deacylase